MIPFFLFSLQMRANKYDTFMTLHRFGACLEFGWTSQLLEYKREKMARLRGVEPPTSGSGVQ
jgi:hypothetical protein